MNIGPRLTYSPSGVLLTAPYDAQLTPVMVGELKRQIPQHGRRYLADTREWFIGTAYEAQARAIFRSCWPYFEEDEGVGADPSQQQPRDPRPPFAEDGHYAALHLLPSAPRELIDSAYKTLVKLNHPDRLPVPDRERAHRCMIEINGAYEALHTHAVAGVPDGDDVGAGPGMVTVGPTGEHLTEAAFTARYPCGLLIEMPALRRDAPTGNEAV